MLTYLLTAVGLLAVYGLTVTNLYLREHEELIRMSHRHALLVKSINRHCRHD